MPHHQQIPHDPAAIAEDDSLRSQYMRHLLCRPNSQRSSENTSAVPRVLVQFWDTDDIPEDVASCLESWAPVEAAGFTRLLFDDDSARNFIEKHFDPRHLTAFDTCVHPAMRADYFRLCYMMRFGGVYVDADDEYQGADLEPLVNDGLLRVQALCYDVTTDSMVNVRFAKDAEKNNNRIFYANNNPLIAGPAHPVIMSALGRATRMLVGRAESNRDIQTLTGPGNLTTALVQHAAAMENGSDPADFEVLTNWDTVAISKWPLAYRKDGRDWRKWARGEDLPQQRGDERA